MTSDPNKSEPGHDDAPRNVAEVGIGEEGKERENGAGKREPFQLTVQEPLRQRAANNNRGMADEQSIADSPAPKSASARASAPKPAGTKDNGAVSIRVSASHLQIHPALNISLDEFSEAHAKDIDAATDLLRRGAPLANRPEVIDMGDGTFGAISGLEVIAAAIRLAAKQPTASIAVIKVDGIDPARALSEQLRNPRHRSGWEQYCALAPIFEGVKVRKKLRELELDIKGWETKISKALKVGRLDTSILDSVNRFTISADKAGQIVDAWNDPVKKRAMERVLAEVRAGTNDRIAAVQLFEAMLKAARPDMAKPAWRDCDNGGREFVAADGNVLGSFSIGDNGWKAEGIAMSVAQWRAMVQGMRPPKR